MSGFDGLTFSELRKANVDRCETSFHPVNEWNPLEWAGALCGEAGELANICKKMVRQGKRMGDQKSEEYIPAAAEELADVVIYADLLAARLGISLSEAVSKKFNKVSQKLGVNVVLMETDSA